MSKPKSLIVGASGQVGAGLLEAIGADNAIATSRNAPTGWMQLDLSELAEKSQLSSTLDAVGLETIYCVGGMTYVDGCEEQSDLAHRTNARGPSVLAAYAKRRGLSFVYFSTEYVFDGSKENPGPYAEGAAPNPLNVYGKSKLAGEQLVMAAHDEALIVRTTVVYGSDPRKKNYVYSLLNILREGKTMQVAEDQISTPTYNRDLVQATLRLVETKVSGIVHVCGPELMGRLAFAREVAHTFGLNASLLQGVSTTALRQTAKRPLSAGLASQRLNDVYPGFRMRSLAEGLADCRVELSSSLQAGLVPLRETKTS